MNPINPNDAVILSLQQQITELKAQVNLLTQTNAVPRNIENALAERLNTANAVTAGSTSSVSYASYTSFSVVVPLVTGKLALTTPSGITYNVLYG
jgi:hypothetical protein